MIPAVLLRRAMAAVVVPRDVAVSAHLVGTRPVVRLLQHAAACETAAPAEGHVDAGPCAKKTPPANIGLLRRLRRDTDASMSLARRAAMRSPDNYDAALAWLLRESAAAGAAVSLRTPKSSQGLLALFLPTPGTADATAAASSSAHAPPSDGHGPQYACIAETGVVSDVATRTARFIVAAKSIPHAISKAMATDPLGSKTDAAIRKIGSELGPLNEVATICETTSGILKEAVTLRRAVIWRCDQRTLESKAFGWYLQASDGDLMRQGVGRYASVVAINRKKILNQTVDSANCSQASASAFARFLARAVVAYSPKTVGELRGMQLLDIDLGPAVESLQSMKLETTGVKENAKNPAAGDDATDNPTLAAVSSIGAMLDCCGFEIDSFVRMTVGEANMNSVEIIRPNADAKLDLLDEFRVASITASSAAKTAACTAEDQKAFGSFEQEQSTKKLI